jgi:hypothetical protein
VIEHPSSTELLLAQLREYKALIDAKNAGLDALSQSNKSLLLALKNDLTDSVDVILNRRGKQCEQMQSLCLHLDKRGPALKLAQDIAQKDCGEIGMFARDLLALKQKADSAAEEILAEQKVCIALMRSRLDATSRALKQSVQKRKLVAAYGSACSNSTPAFLDKQR